MVEFYSFKPDAKHKISGFGNLSVVKGMRTSFNLHRGKDAPVICNTTEGYLLKPMSWGIAPENTSLQTNKNELRLTNARMEGILSQTSFRFALRSQRCLIPMDSYYLRKGKKDGGHQAYRICRNDKEIMYAAGVWQYTIEGEEVNYSFCLITSPSNDDVKNLGSRMPKIFFDMETAIRWLGDVSIADISALLNIPEANNLFYYKIVDALEAKIDDAILHEIEEKQITLFDL